MVGYYTAFFPPSLLLLRLGNTIDETCVYMPRIYQAKVLSIVELRYSSVLETIYHWQDSLQPRLYSALLIVHETPVPSRLL